MQTYLRTLINRNTVYQNVTLVFCVLFGLAMIANTQSAGDSMWFWYAWFFLGGKHLYADMHLAMQPVFVLETAACMSLLGKGWLVSKVPAVFHLVAYCVGLLLLVRSSRLSDGGKAIVLASAFFVSIAFEAYRFDDYHVLADCFEVYSLVLLLMLQRATGAWRGVGLAAMLGVFSGLSAMTRLNDGAVLFLAAGMGIVCLAPVRRLISLAVFGVSCALTALIVVKLTGDSLRSYATYSIFKAAAIKGGTGNVLVYPLKLPWNTLRFLMNWHRLEFALYILGAAAIWSAVILPFLHTRRRSDLVKLGAGLVLILLPLPHLIFGGELANAYLIEVLSAVGGLLLYGFGLIVSVRFLFWIFGAAKMRGWDRREILFLIPLGRLASYSMSSGGWHYGIYGPIGILILLVAFISPIRVKRESVKGFLLAVATILMIHCAVFKYRHPYRWHSYNNGMMFVGREWYRHPVYGPMVVERPFLQFVEPICTAMRDGGDERELLSLPFSYPNYFCSIDPWHGYVQTFFDTSSKETIDGLMDELEKSPPKWIVYQRQLTNLKVHENLYNQGNPLPHRYLDQMIVGKITSGAWQPVYKTTYGTFPAFDNEWILLRTRP